MQRADQSLIVAVVAEGAPRRTDSGAERRLGDDAPVPDRLDQLVLAHDPVAVAERGKRAGRTPAARYGRARRPAATPAAQHRFRNRRSGNPRASPVCKANASPPLANHWVGQQRIYTHTKSNLQRDFKEFQTKRHPGSRASEEKIARLGRVKLMPGPPSRLDEDVRSHRKLLFHQAIARSRIARLSGT